MQLNPKEAHTLSAKFLNRWDLADVKKINLQEYVGIKNKDTFCYWIETETKRLGSIKGHFSNKFGIYERVDKTRIPKSTDFLYDDKYTWWKKYGSTRDAAFNSVKQNIIEVIEAASEADFKRIDGIVKILRKMKKYLTPSTKFELEVMK